MANITPRRLEGQTPNLVCGLLKHVAVIWSFFKKNVREAFVGYGDYKRAGTQFL